MRGVHIFEKPCDREIRVMRGRAMRGLPVLATYFKKHRRCLSYKVNLVLRKSRPSSELILCGSPQGSQIRGSRGWHPLSIYQECLQVPTHAQCENIQNLSYTLSAFEIFEIAQKTKKLVLSSYSLGSCQGVPVSAQAYLVREPKFFFSKMAIHHRKLC